MNVDALLADLSEMLDVVDLHNPTAVLGRPLAVVLTHVELNQEGEESFRSVQAITGEGALQLVGLPGRAH
jgi:hypothetical protein